MSHDATSQKFGYILAISRDTRSFVKLVCQQTGFGSFCNNKIQAVKNFKKIFIICIL